ncbi:unnamed protein product [Cuscuta campestris]|uniref:Uncharacterized protein n=1 Tax=Cuscuta campestris TaxID=132261 RepID=A0A484NA21_9ASTE|nr:unnamed protein product [Cuscuta campestris]
MASIDRCSVLVGCCCCRITERSTVALERSTTSTVPSAECLIDVAVDSSATAVRPSATAMVDEQPRKMFFSLLSCVSSMKLSGASLDTGSTNEVSSYDEDEELRTEEQMDRSRRDGRPEESGRADRLQTVDLMDRSDVHGRPSERQNDGFLRDDRTVDLVDRPDIHGRPSERQNDGSKIRWISPGVESRVTDSTATAVRSSTASTIAIPASAVALRLSAVKLSAIVLSTATTALLSAACRRTTAALLPETGVSTVAEGGQGSPLIAESSLWSTLSFEEEKCRSGLHESWWGVFGIAERTPGSRDPREGHVGKDKPPLSSVILLSQLLLIVAVQSPSASSPIKIVVVLVMENRSFDHMLGWMKQKVNPEIDGVDGSQFNPISTAILHSLTLPFKLSMSLTNAQLGRLKKLGLKELDKQLELDLL